MGWPPSSFSSQAIRGKNISITCIEHQAKNSSFDINETKYLKSQGGLRICKVKEEFIFITGHTAKKIFPSRAPSIRVKIDVYISENKFQGQIAGLIHCKQANITAVGIGQTLENVFMAIW